MSAASPVSGDLHRDIFVRTKPEYVPIRDLYEDILARVEALNDQYKQASKLEDKSLKLRLMTKISLGASDLMRPLNDAHEEHQKEAGFLGLLKGVLFGDPERLVYKELRKRVDQLLVGSTHFIISERS